ncbi:TetR family transcriptional regulator [Nocardia brasiliensis]|uniref:TetR family transcriptional regulator n=1 Tax=Nocardia brasiliensis TaxID=37326 RepID=A0A6G9XKD6_NOCBR|nr:TetR/AcrR family transcriptional regulator [Nocardia brasiliensis]QIS01376.1 TetR family transcriptional regulator [Nocardia brasiliensis]
MSRRDSILESAARVVAQRGIRGLRVEELAEAAGVSTSLIYYHFKDRAGLLAQTLDFISARAERYTDAELDVAADPIGHLEQVLLLELQDQQVVVENSTAWGEYRSAAIFQPELREQLGAATMRWNGYLGEVIRTAQDRGLVGAEVVPGDAAERLTALVEGVSMRWLSGALELGRARALVRDAIALELGRVGVA